MRAVISSMRSSGNGGSHSGFMAMLMSFIGLSSAATRLELKRPAALAAVDDSPFAASAHPNSHRLHDAAAVGRPVAGLDVDVQAGKAVRTVVAVVAAGVLRRAEPAADLAGEGIVAGVRLVVAFFQRSCVCFRGSWRFLRKKDHAKFFGRNGVCWICRTSRSGHTLR